MNLRSIEQKHSYEFPNKLITLYNKTHWKKVLLSSPEAISFQYCNNDAMDKSFVLA